MYEPKFHPTIVYVYMCFNLLDLFLAQSLMRNALANTQFLAPYNEVAASTETNVKKQIRKLSKLKPRR